MLDKFRKGAQKAGMQASAFLKDGSSKIANESHNFAQGFTLPGEAEKAAKILASFLGESLPGVIARPHGSLMKISQRIPITLNLP